MGGCGEDRQCNVWPRTILPMHTLTLQTGELRLRVSPTLGASLLALDAHTAGGWAPILADTERCDLAAASFLMVPYSNRVADGAFRFDGRAVRLGNAENHAIHGEVRKRPWRVIEATTELARLGFRSADHGGLSWPWAFDVEVEYALRGSCFSSVLRLTNRADSPMPAGFGFHPYFVRDEPVRVRFGVRGIFPDVHGTRIPSGPAEIPDAERDFSVERALPAASFMDFCAHGWDGRAGIAWPDRGLRIGIEASPELGHLVFYNPPKPYFALEPVSNANDGVNLLARGDPNSGVRVLMPGESFSARLDVRVQRD